MIQFLDLRSTRTANFVNCFVNQLHLATAVHLKWAYHCFSQVDNVDQPALERCVQALLS